MLRLWLHQLTMIFIVRLLLSTIQTKFSLLEIKIFMPFINNIDQGLQKSFGSRAL